MDALWCNAEALFGIWSWRWSSWLFATGTCAMRAAGQLCLCARLEHCTRRFGLSPAPTYGLPAWSVQANSAGCATVWHLPKAHTTPCSGSEGPPDPLGVLCVLCARKALWRAIVPIHAPPPSRQSACSLYYDLIRFLLVVRKARGAWDSGTEAPHALHIACLPALCSAGGRAAAHQLPPDGRQPAPLLPARRLVGAHAGDAEAVQARSRPGRGLHLFRAGRWPRSCPAKCSPCCRPCYHCAADKRCRAAFCSACCPGVRGCSNACCQTQGGEESHCPAAGDWCCCYWSAA